MLSYEDFAKRRLYRNRLKQIEEDPQKFYDYVGDKTDYDRYLKYYQTKATMEEYGLDQNVIAPGYSAIDDMIDNRDAYIDKYGMAGYNQIYSAVYNQAKPSIENINKVVGMKKAGLFSADVLNTSTQLKERFVYDPKNENDKWREYLGYVPEAFDNAARDIVAQAEQTKKSRADSKKTTGEIAFEATHGPKQSADYWNSIGNSNKPITEQELREAIKIINEETGDVSVEEHNNNLAIIEYAKQNPQIYGSVIFKGQPLSSVDINNISSKLAAEFVNYITEYNKYKSYTEMKQQQLIGHLLDAQEEKQKQMQLIEKRAQEVENDPKFSKNPAKMVQGIYYVAYGKNATADDIEKIYDLGLASTGLPKNNSKIEDKAFADMYSAQIYNIYNGLSDEERAGYRKDVARYITYINLGVDNNIQSYIDIYEDIAGRKPTTGDMVALSNVLNGNEELTNEVKEFLDRSIRVAISADLVNYTQAAIKGEGSTAWLQTPLGMLGRGVNDWGGGLRSLALTAGSSLGGYFIDYDASARLKNYYNDKSRLTNEQFAQMLQNTPDYAPWTSTLQDIGAGIVTTGLDMVTGKALGSAFGKVTGIAPAVKPTIVNRVASTPALKVMFLRTLGDNTEKFKDSGVLWPVYATADAAVNTWIEGMGDVYSPESAFARGIKKAPKGFLNKVSNLALNWSKSTGGELGEEVLQAGASSIIDSMANGTPMTESQFAKEFGSLESLAETGLSIILTVGVFGLDGSNSNKTQEIRRAYEQGKFKKAAQLEIDAIIEIQKTGNINPEDARIFNSIKNELIVYVNSDGQSAVTNPNDVAALPASSGTAEGAGISDAQIDQTLKRLGITPQSLPTPATPATAPQNLQTPLIPAAPGTRRAGQSYAPGTAINKLKYNVGKTLKSNTGLGVYDMIPQSAATVYEGYAANMNRAGIGDVITRYSDTVETRQNRKGQDTRVRERTYTKDNAAEVVAALEQSYRTGTKEQQQKLLVIAMEVAPSSGRAFDKMQLLSKLNATGRKFAIERELGRINAIGRQKYKAKWNELRLTDADIKAIKKAHNQKELDRARKEILKRLGDAMPATMAEKAAALSKIVKQLIPQTHIKNLSRHSLTWAVIEVRDKVAAVAGLFARRELRTTSFLVGKDKKAKVNNYYKERNVADEFSKYKAGGSPLGQKRVFKGGALDAASKGTSKVSATESLWFMADRYKRSLGRYMQSQGLTEVTPGAHEYAMNEAVKSVNSQKNAATRALAKIKGIKGVGAALDFVAPSAETKVNAVIRKLEYSPFGIGKAGYDFIRTLDASRRIDNYVKQMKTASPAEIKDLQASIAGEKDNMRKYAQKAINDLAQGITGTGLYFLGLLLASGKLIPGVEITGLEPPTEEDDFLKSTGWQPLSLKIGNTYISLDWAEPISSMLLVGAETYHAIEESGNNSWYAVPLETLQALGEDILKSSGFSGIRDALRDSKDFGSAVVGVGSELVSQHIPSLGGAVNNIIEPYKISNDGDTLDKAKNKAMMSVPGLRRALEGAGADVPAAATDAWGQPVSAGSLPERLINNLVSPAKITHGNSDSVTAEVKRLYDATGNADVFPLSAGTISNELKLDKLTKREAAQIQDEVKQGFYNAVSAYMSSAQYQADNDDTRVAAIRGIYDSLIEEYRRQFILRKIPPAPKAAAKP